MKKHPTPVLLGALVVLMLLSDRVLPAYETSQWLRWAFVVFSGVVYLVILEAVRPRMLKGE
jgi:hypothetical protein